MSPLVVVGNEKSDYQDLNLAGAVDSVSREEIEGAYVYKYDGAVYQAARGEYCQSQPGSV